MELLRLVLLLCVVGQALGKPIFYPKKKPQENMRSHLGPTVYDVIEAANNDAQVLLKEGDIAMSISRNARECKACRWNKNRNGIVQVPYIIAREYSASDKSLISEALKEFEVMTCVQFVNRVSEPDYIYIESKEGCYSKIGRTTGRQTVSLARSDCMYYGVIQHEAMHSLGFYHEHTREDRDKYIDILWQNLKPDSKKDLICNGINLNLPYDYASVMHYNKYAYSIDPSLPTIVPKPDPNVPIGQRSGMTNLDVMKINTLYSCNLCREKLLTDAGRLSINSFYVNQRGGNCLWLIQVSNGQVSLEISLLNVSSTDYLKVYDGISKSSRVLLETTNGNEPISPLVSTGRNMLVEFVSKKDSNFSEFDASFEMGLDNFGGIYQESNVNGLCRVKLVSRVTEDIPMTKSLIQK